MATGVGSFLDKVLPSNITVAVDPMPEVSAAENLGAATIKLITELQAEANSPDMQKAEAAKQRLQEMDALTIAQQQNDVAAERAAFEARAAQP